MDGEFVSDIAVEKLDLTGLPILHVYSKASGVYAVYANSERIMVQYSDRPELAKDQRLALAHLAPLRGEINGLIDGWRIDRSTSNQSRAKRYDRRTADALVVALQGDQDSAKVLLEGIKADIIDERKSIARSEYMAFASCCAVLIFAFFWWLTPSQLASDTSLLRKFAATNSLWLATGVGSLGALFSIAIAIRSREIHTDLRLRDNLVDAVLRVAIGSISAFILFSLLKSQLVSFSVGATPVQLASGEDAAGKEIVSGGTTHVAIVVAFIAGFSERLVGSFLGSTTLDATGQKPLTSSKPAEPPKQKNADEENPLGLTVQGVSAPAKAGAADIDETQSVDACLCDVHLAENDNTLDEDLPPASGGIEKRA